MNKSDILERGRQAFRKQMWTDAYSLLLSADRENNLEPVDLETLAKAAYLIGKETDCTDNWMRAHQKYLNQNNTRRAANCAFWIGMIFILKGDKAQGSGWIARAGRLIEANKKECAEQGFLLIPKALQCLRSDAKKAYDLFNKASEIGRRCSNVDLLALGRLGRGQALIRQNKITEGTTLFDETMVAVVSDEISPIVAGIIYCAVIETCSKIYDLQRAQEWTTALSRWCDSQPDLIPYRGQCLIRRAEIMQLHGDWPDAMNELQQAGELSQTSNSPTAAEAFYRQGDLHRLQGNFSEAETKYRLAGKWGRNPQPGLALLRLAQGQIDAAKKAISHVENENKEQMARTQILPAYVKIMLATENVRSAEDAATELTKIANILGAPFLQAIADQSYGDVLLSNAKPGSALKKLYRARALLRNVSASYESARTQVLIGLACRKLGDEPTAEMEFATAREIFQLLGATPDLNKVESLIGNSTSKKVHGLTSRELQVLRLLTTGKTNKNIANELFISERTVDRHVSNILGKLNVPSRSAATAYAYEHDLI